MMAPSQQIIAQQPAQVSIRSDLQPLAHPDPTVNAYNMAGFKLLPAVVPANPNYKN